MTNSILFTDLAIKKLVPPIAGQQRYWDKDLPGFGIRLSQGGARTWILLDPRNKIRTQETIGRYPLLALKDARGEAKKRLAEYTLGKTAKALKTTWNAATVEYLAEVKKRRKPRTHLDYERLLGRFKFATTPMRELTQEAIMKKLSRLEETPAEYIHAFVVLRAFFNWSYRRSYLDESPLARMTVGQYNERDRTLTDEELKKVWNAATGKFGRIVKQLILTGQRRGEIVAYDPAWKEKDTITFPAWLTKNNRTHTFPIGPMTEALIGDNSWKGWSNAKAQLDKRSGVTGWTLHDLRRTLRTKWAELGIPREIAKKYINHISSGKDSKVDRIYDRHTYLPEMRAAVAKWEIWLARTVLANS